MCQLGKQTQKATHQSLPLNPFLRTVPHYQAAKVASRVTGPITDLVRQYYSMEEVDDIEPAKKLLERTCNNMKTN